MNNPFLALYEVMAEATKIEASFFIAKVVSPLPSLKIQLNDIELDKDNLLIDKWLKDRNESLFTEYEVHSHGGDTTGDGRHRHQIKEHIHDKLKVDDRVLLLKVNDKFLVLSKVVSIWVYFLLLLMMKA